MLFGSVVLILFVTVILCIVLLLNIVRGRESQVLRLLPKPRTGASGQISGTIAEAGVTSGRP